MTNDSFNELVSKLFSCNLLLLSTEDTKRLFRNQFDANLDAILNQFSIVSHLNQMIRDSSSHMTYTLNSLRLRFTDYDALKSRPNSSQIKKLLFECVSSMSNSEILDCGDSLDTPWFEKWKNMFIDTFETTEHEFIGTYFGCFFVITAKELNNFKDILASLLTQVKQLSTVRWIQSDFVRFYVVVSEEPIASNAMADETQTYQQLYNELNSMYANSYWLHIQTSKTDINDEVFNDKSGTDSVDNVNHLIEESGDPLSASLINKRLINNERLSSSSDQYATNSINSNAAHNNSKITNEIDLMNSSHSQSANESFSLTIETFLKEFIVKTLIPWSEKQIKLLSESISQRKGFRRSIFSATKSLINNMSSSTVGLKSGNMNQSVIYSLDAPEMQQRKLGDLAMCLTMYELAFNSYYSTRKEFQSEGAWIYYASASEASAIASFFTHKFNRHHFDHAINCYIDTCKAINCATRATILATESISDYFPNDAANLFIRMTGDDSDLRSGLFLEQASKCFAIAKSRIRKSAFHYVLAGHRYNRCGLKHFALACYRRFNSSEWSYAADHVNLTISRLYLSIANSAINNSRYTDYKKQGLELMRVNANKQIFYQEFLREIKKDLENANINSSACDPIYFNLEIPYIISVSIETIEGTPTQSTHNICFANEDIVFKLLLISPFSLELRKLKFYCSDDANANCIDVMSTLECCEQTVVYLRVIPRNECEFQIMGIEYEVENLVVIRREISDKIRKSLKFRSIRALPLIGIDIACAAGDTQSVSPTQVFCGEIIEILINLGVRDNGWKPSNMVMTTNANIIADFQSDNKSEQRVIAVCFDKQNTFKMQIPTQIGHHSVHFKLQYTDDTQNKTRVITKTVDFNVTECLHLENIVANVISLRNLLINETITVGALGSESYEIPAALTAHILVDGASVAWSVANRCGHLMLSN